MKTYDFFYDSDDGKHLIYAKYWIPSTPPVGIIQFIVGMFEHTGRYEEAAEFFTNNGFICCCNDHLGQGQSSSEVRGFFGYNNGIKHLLADIMKLKKKTTDRFPNLPYFLLGCSLGSFLERLLISEPRVAESLSGAIIAATAGPNPDIDFQVAKAKNIVSIEGPKTPSVTIMNESFGEFPNYFPNEDDPLNWVTTIKGRRKKYAEDKMTHFTYTNAAFRDLFVILERIQSDQVINSTDRRLPLLFIAGKDDPVGNFGNGVREVANLYIDAGLDDVALKIFPKVRHDILYDYPATQNKTLPFVLSWISARTNIYPY